MVNLTDYVPASLDPLGEKVQAYLTLEREIRLQEVEMRSMQALQAGMDEEPATDTPNTSERKGESLREKQQELYTLLERYEQQRQEVIHSLPAHNKFININLDDGPVQVGYFTLNKETQQPLPEPMLRIVH